MNARPQSDLAARDGERIRADVVVIGCGVGGSVAACAFARAGKTVIVVDAGTHDANAAAQRDGLPAVRLPDRIADEWGTESGIASLAADLRPHYDALEATLATARVVLPDVAAHGGRIYGRARPVAIELGGSRARGVRVEQTLASGDVRRFDIAADLVVVAAGTLRTPGLLARSGIRHPSLGKRLFLHPVCAIFSRYDDVVNVHERPMRSASWDAFAWQHGNYGARIEAAPARAALAALALPWQGRARPAALMNRMRHQAGLIAVTRDRDSGAVDPDDEAAIRYSVSPFDAEHLLAGIVGMADIAFASGATEIAVLHTAPIRIARDAWKSARRARIVEALGHRGIASKRRPIFSAHQMGTAAIGSRPADSVVDPSGRVWGYDNLLVADASLFPQASGVDPALTTMALANYVAAQHGGVTDARGKTITA